MPESWAENVYDEGIGLVNDSYFLSDDDMAGVLSSKADGVNLITIFDTCYSGGLVGGASDLNSVSDIAVLASSRENQLSMGGLPYSLFTQALIDGLDQALIADTDADHQLFTYAETSLSDSIMDPLFYSDFTIDDMPVILHVVPIPGTFALLSCPGFIFIIFLKRKRC